MKPKFLFTLGGDLGAKVISEPEGWADITFNLERDPTYWSLVENFEVSLTFYGTNNSNIDGGYNYIKSARDNGINTNVTLDIEVSFDNGNSYESCFNGLVDLSTCKELIYRYKIEAAILRNDAWSTFINNKSTPIDVMASTDIYGNSIESISSFTLPLPSQSIQKEIIASIVNGGLQDSNQTVKGGGSIINYVVFSYDTYQLQEINDVVDGYPLQMDIVSPLDKLLYLINPVENNVLTVKAGTTFNLSLSLNISDLTHHAKVQFFGYSLTTGEQALTTQVSVLGSTFLGRTKFTLNNTTGSDVTFTVPVGQRFYLYGKLIWDGSDTTSDFQLSNITSSITITSDTTLPDTSCDALFVHDVGLSICDKIIGANSSMYSAYFGGSGTKIVYGANGCGYLNSLTRGLNIRGYTLSEKPFTINFDDWWSGVNPTFALGLGYENSLIRIEQKSYFFDDSSYSAVFTAINDIEVEFDMQFYNKTIQIGFEQWQAESSNGIDDPQTNHIYNTIFKILGKDEKQMSKFIAASLAIEQTRRLTKVQNQDWRLDENIFLIALNGSLQPETFGSGITGLDNSTTRYNVRHTPARMMERWNPFYSGAMQDYLSSFFAYASGEGNVLMSWTGDGGCDSGTLTENQNIAPTSGYLFLPVVYSFTHPCTWNQYKSMRNNRNLAISISWIDPTGTTQQLKAFIKKIGYMINSSKADFQVWIKI